MKPQTHVTNADLSQELTMATRKFRPSELRDNINVALSNIGNTEPTKPPKCKSNEGPIAWELFVARHLETMVAARVKRAKQEAIRAGIIFDHEKNPRPAGTNQVIYSGEQVCVWLEVREPGTRVDANRLCDYLREKRVPQKVIDEAVAVATVANKPAHVFRVSMVDTETSLAK